LLVAGDHRVSFKASDVNYVKHIVSKHGMIVNCQLRIAY
jgi:hypothetical protein